MSEYYRVERAATQPECQCQNCVMWTVVFTDNGEEIEIGTSFEGERGLEAAEETRDLMNMAFDRGAETKKQIEAVVHAADKLDNCLAEFGIDPSACAELAGVLNDELAVLHSDGWFGQDQAPEHG